MQRSWVRISSLISGVKRTWFHCRICRRSRPASGPGKPPCPCSCRRKPASCCSSHSSSFVVGPAGSASLPVRDIRSDLIRQRMIRSIRRPATRGKSGVGSSCLRNSQFRKSLLPAVNFNLGSLWLIVVNVAVVVVVVAAAAVVVDVVCLFKSDEFVDLKSNFCCNYFQRGLRESKKKSALKQKLILKEKEKLNRNLFYLQFSCFDYSWVELSTK